MLEASPRGSSRARAARQSTEAMRRRHPPRPGVGVSTPVVASICSVMMESAREAATQTCSPLGRMTRPRGPPIRVEGVQPAVAAEPTQDTRVSAPLAGSRRNDSTASSSVPGRDQRVAVRRDRERGGPRQPSDRGAASELAVAQAAHAEGELRQRPGRHVTRERGQRAGARGDVERRPVLGDRDRRWPVEAGDRSAVGAVRADAARRTGQLGEAPAGRVAREHEQRVGRVAGDVDEAAVRRDRDCVRAAQRGTSGAARRGRVGDAACDAGELNERSVGLAGEARDRCRGRRRHVDVQVVGRHDDRRRALEPARGGAAFLRDRARGTRRRG